MFDSSDFSFGVYTLFRVLSIVRYVSKSLSIAFRETKFETFCELVAN